MVIFSTMLFWKLPDNRYVQSSFSASAKHIGKSIWETSYNWRTTDKDHIRASSFAVKHHEMEIEEVASKIISYTKIQTCTLKDIKSK